MKRTVLVLVTCISVTAPAACAQDVRMVEVDGRQVRVRTAGLEGGGPTTCQRRYLAEYVGRYDGPPGQFQVTLENGHLFAQLANQPAVAIYAESETEFFYKVVDAQMTFIRDAGGAVSGLVLHQSGRDLRWEKVR